MSIITSRYRILLITLICTLIALSGGNTLIVKAQGNPVPPYVTAAFADLSQRLGKTYAPAPGLRGVWSYNQITVPSDNVNLGCPPHAGLPSVQGHTAAWQIIITLNDVGTFDYRASMKGDAVFLCSGPGITSTSTQTLQPTAIQDGCGPAGCNPPPPSQVTYQAPMIAYIEAYSGNVAMTSLGTNPGPTMLTGDSIGAELTLNLKTSEQYTSLTWSPDGTSLAFVRVGHGASDADVFVANSGQAPKKVASTRAGIPWGVTWSPDGKELAYATVGTGSNDLETFQLMAVARTGGQPRVIGSFSVPAAGGGFMPSEPSEGLYASESSTQHGVLIWTSAGIIHSTSTWNDSGLAFSTFDGKQVWRADVTAPVVSPDRTRAIGISIQSAQPVLINLANGQITAFPLSIKPDVMAWSPDSQTIYYSTSTKISEVQINKATPGFTALNQVNAQDFGGPLDKAVSNTVQLWSVAATGGTPQTLFSMEGYRIGAISVSPLPNSQLVSFSFIESAAALFNAANAGKTDFFTLFPRIRIGTIVPGQSPVFFDGAKRQPVISAGAQFVAVPATPINLGGNPGGANSGTNGTVAANSCSPNVSAVSVMMTVVNNSDQDVVLAWIDVNCKQVDYGVIAAGTSKQQQSYLGHIWIVKTRDNKVQKTFSAVQGTITVQ